MTPKLKDYFPKTQDNGLGWPHVQLLVSEKHKILYRPIAKNACSSLKRLMVSIADIKHGQLMIDADIHESIDNYRTGAKLGDLDIDYARQIMASAEYFKFVVVRDPFDRLVSAYLEKFVINRKNRDNPRHTSSVIAAIQGLSAPDFDRGISFADFVRHVTSQDPEQLDPHWKPQMLYLRDVDYDRIYRMDQLDILRRDLENRIGHTVTLPHRNRSHIGHPRYVPDSAYRLPGELTTPLRIDKNSFMTSEIMLHIVNYFADDYRLYYSDDRNSPGPADSGSTGHAVQAKRKSSFFLRNGLRSFLRNGWNR